MSGTGDWELDFEKDFSQAAPMQVKLEAERQQLEAICDLADRKRLLGHITADQEQFVLDLLQEAVG